jgi:ABC-type phosphate transport system permease subunit
MLIYSWTGRPQPPTSDYSFTEAAAAAGLTLLVIVLLFNAAAIYLRNRFERTRDGA